MEAIWTVIPTVQIGHNTAENGTRAWDVSRVAR